MKQEKPSPNDADAFSSHACSSWAGLERPSSMRKPTLTWRRGESPGARSIRPGCRASGQKECSSRPGRAGHLFKSSSKKPERSRPAGPTDPNTDMGTLRDQAGMDRMRELVRDAVRKGATAWTPGRDFRDGSFQTLKGPTILFPGRPSPLSLGRHKTKRLGPIVL